MPKTGRPKPKADRSVPPDSTDPHFILESNGKQIVLRVSALQEALKKHA